MSARKLIEVALPLDAINRASSREKSIRHGHPCTLHPWWSRKPLAACRAMLFAQLVDDPSAHPDRFPSERDQDDERQRLFEIIERLITWEHSGDEALLAEARAEIARSAGAVLPQVLDVFCGGGSIPLEAQRLGMPAVGRDLNPVAALITKAMIELPGRFAGKPPLHAEAAAGERQCWPGASALAADVKYCGSWMRAEAERRLGHLYPVAPAPAAEDAPQRVLAWIWARTAICPNPACGLRAPLTTSWELCRRPDARAWIEPVIDHTARSISYAIRTGKGTAPTPTVDRRGARCAACGQPITFEQIRASADAGGLASDLVAMAMESAGGPSFLPPDVAQVEAARNCLAENVPETNMPDKALGFRVQKYGLRQHRDLFTARQLMLLTTMSDLVQEAHALVLEDARLAGLADDRRSVGDGGSGARAYADVVATYLAFAVNKLIDRHTALVPWDPTKGVMGHTFARAILPMIWTFVEANPFVMPSADLSRSLAYVCELLEALPAMPGGSATQDDALLPAGDAGPYVVSTDPPYYDNIGYADLSDIFYVWLRRSLRTIHPQLFTTMLVPKAHELIADPARHNGDAGEARRFFESGLGSAFEQIRRVQHPEYPLTIYYAFRQTEQDTTQGVFDEMLVTSTGWEAMLTGLLGAELMITGTWPVRTEGSGRVRAHGSNAVVSSIVLVCRPRPSDAPLGTRRDFLQGLAERLPAALRCLQQDNIAPVDLAQAAIGPGMAVFSRYQAVLEVDGSPMRVRAALGLINQMLDQVLAEREGDYDAETRWALMWYEGFGHRSAPFGEAETLSKAKNVPVNVLHSAGIVEARGGKVRLLPIEELPDGWDPARSRITIWQATHYLARALDKGGEMAAAALLGRLHGHEELAKELAYRLYLLCTKKGWTEEAVSYNALVVAWPAITALARRALPVPQLFHNMGTG